MARSLASSKPGLVVEGACPECASFALRRYYHLHRQYEPTEVNGEFVGVGGLWEWCAVCHAYEHYRAQVPSWWASDLEVPATV
jgi:hypothetical protein